MKKLILFYRYCSYRLKAVNEHGVHSPFVFSLLTNVIYNHTDYYSYRNIENLRDQLLNSKKTVSLKKAGTVEHKISQLVKELEKPAKYEQLLFRLVNHFQPDKIIELADSLGIGTIYMASANSEIKVISIMEQEPLAEVAKKNYKMFQLKNIEQLSGVISDVLPNVLLEEDGFCFLSIHGNHSKKKVLQWFNQCIEHTNESSVFIIADIYTSFEMKEAWNEIKNNNRVTVTIDLFFIGIVFFRKEQVKQHFVIKF